MRGLTFTRAPHLINFLIITPVCETIITRSAATFLEKASFFGRFFLPCVSFGRFVGLSGETIREIARFCRLQRLLSRFFVFFEDGNAL